MRLLGAALCLFTLTASSVAARDIVLLGDSFSDDGNGYAATVKLVLQTNSTYPQNPYYMGRWSNGPVWIEFAAKALGAKLLDFGAGGATTGTAPAQLPPLPVGFANLTVPTTVLSYNIYQQYNQLLLATNGTLDSTPVYIIYIGGNDLLSIAVQNTSVTAPQMTKNIQTILDMLYSKGARTFVLGLLPKSLATLPLFTHPDLYGNYSARLSTLDQQTAAYVTATQQLASSYANSHPGATVSAYNWGQALQNVLANAANFGFTNIKDACYLPPNSGLGGFLGRPIGRAGGTTCANPSEYAFWDEVHPTTISHQAVGADFVNTFGQSLFGVSTHISAPPPAQGPVRAPLPALKTPPALKTAPARGPTITG